jgi:hypothetical protein
MSVLLVAGSALAQSADSGAMHAGGSAPQSSQSSSQEGKSGGEKEAADDARDRPMLRAMLERQTPEQLRDALARKQRSLREQLEAVEQAEALLAQGKPPADAARVLVGTEHPILLDGLADGMRGRRGLREAREDAGPGRDGPPRDGPPREGPGREPRDVGREERRDDRPESRAEGRPEGRREDRRVVLEAIKAELPAVHERLDALRASDPVMAERVVERLVPRVREAVRVRERDPELARLRMREVGSSFDVLAKIRGYRDADGALSSATKAADGAAQESARAAVEAARVALRDAMASNFADKLAMAEADATNLARQQRELGERIEQAKARRDELIDAAMVEVQAGRMPRPMLEERGRVRD